MMMRFELGSITVAKGRDEWTAAGIVLIPYAGAIVLLSALGVDFGFLLGMTVGFGIPASGARIRLARHLHARRCQRRVSTRADGNAKPKEEVGGGERSGT
jgi:hypothetical protein